MRIFQNRHVRLAIPNPCNENWDQMDGAGRERFCQKCQSSVVDFSTLTRIEAERLLASSKGGVCGRIVHNERGDVAFRPDPASGKLARIAGLSLAGISGLAAQQPTCQLKVQATDATGAGVPKAKVEMHSDGENPIKLQGETDSTGSFLTRVPSHGGYTITIQTPGFATYRETVDTQDCRAEVPIRVDARLEVGTMGGVVLVEPSPSPLKRLLERLRQ